MPGKFVFPGGRVELADRRMSAATPLDPRVAARLMLAVRNPSAQKSRGFALAAIREVFEETGLVLGSAGPRSGPPPRPPQHAGEEKDGARAGEEKDGAHAGEEKDGAHAGEEKDGAVAGEGKDGAVAGEAKDGGARQRASKGSQRAVGEFHPHRRHA